MLEAPSSRAFTRRQRAIDASTRLKAHGSTGAAHPELASAEVAYPQPQSLSAALLEAQLLLLGSLLGSMTESNQLAILTVCPLLAIMPACLHALSTVCGVAAPEAPDANPKPQTLSFTTQLVSNPLRPAASAYTLAKNGLP